MTIEKCNWLPSGRFCYPGTCKSDGPPSSCECIDGFSGNNCQDIMKDVAMNDCLVKVRRMDGDEEKNQREAQCHDSSPVTAYVNDPGINNIQVTWTVYFTGADSYPDIDTEPRKYVKDFKVGVIGAMASSSIRVHENGDVFTLPSLQCDSSWSRDNPLRSIHTCRKSQDINYAFKHNDRVDVTVTSSNGGYIKMTGHPIPAIQRTEYYNGRSKSLTANLVFDFERPYHCSASRSCSKAPLDRGPAINTEGEIMIRSSGWYDDLSGIEELEVKVMPVKKSHQELICSQDGTTSKTCAHGTASQPFSCSVNVSDPGVYCVLLTVEDNAGNFEHTIRYLMFDNVNIPTIDVNYPMNLLSAEPDSGQRWQTNLQNSHNVGPKISLSWKKHFKNEYHHMNNLLGEIGDFSPIISAEYDDLTGVPPLTRSRQKIPNINGIVAYKICYAVDHAGGRTLTDKPSRWFDVHNFVDEEVHLDIPRDDGDTVRLWVKGIDVIGHEIEDNITVHIDSSPPEIGDIYLTKNGISYLAVHDSVDLFDMRVTFQAFDDHSGLHTIYWTLHDMDQESITHGNGTISVKRPSTLDSECEPPGCACIPKDNECYHRNYEIRPDYSKMNIPTGTHDFDYIFTITVTNNAMLQTSRQFQVTVDTSPPHEGSVHDSRPGDIDIDFQQDTEVLVSWDGFFDRESGIKMYVYHFGESCLDEMHNLSFPIVYPFKNTTSTHARWIAPGHGKYYCTVIAFNRAMAPSKPVCSDGVTIDVTGPTVWNVIVDDVYIKPGLVKDGNGTVWYVDDRRNRQQIDNASYRCSDIARTEINIDSFPISEVDSNKTYVNMQDAECLSIDGASEVGFLRSEHYLSVKWTGQDSESEIYDYEIGISNTPSALDPNIMPFTSTHAHSEFLTYHPNLGEGVEFYLIVRATNRARLSTTKVIGPFIVDVTAPAFDGEIVVTAEKHFGDEEFLVARWGIDAFSDQQPLSSFSVAIGDVEGGSSIMAFTPIEQLTKGLCEVTIPPISCVAIPTSNLSWSLHGEHVYFVSVKVENVAGLHTVATSRPYKHNVVLPRSGTVFEFDKPKDDEELGISNDIDFQTSTAVVHCGWFGFSHPYQNIAYTIALGSSPGSDDIESFQPVETSTSSYTFKGLSLEDYQTYYVTVSATTEVGSIAVSSDGLTIVPTSALITESSVYDGLGYEYTKGHVFSRNESSSPVHCREDINFQSSTSVVAAHWKVSSHWDKFITHSEWALQREERSESSSIWNFVTNYRSMGTQRTLLTSDISLLHGHRYRSIVKFCHSAGCFEAITSDGFWVTPSPPVPMGIEEISYSNVSKELTFQWQGFQQMELPQGVQSNVTPIDRYEWTLNMKASSSITKHGELLFPWKQVNVSQHENDILHSTTVSLPNTLDFTKCVLFGLRGYNKAGLYATTYKDVIDCESFDPRLIVPNTVIDAVGTYGIDGDVKDIFLGENQQWTQTDADYTISDHQLSAVWPTLRHGQYSWKVVRDNAITYNGYQKIVMNYHSYKCDQPQVLGCGKTKSNFVNIADLDLIHGHRYHVCLYANETMKFYEKSAHLLPAVSACSDGVVVDHTPPAAGRVWLDWEQRHFQASTSELIVQWEGFFDVEEYGRTAHESGIRKYEVAIGSSPLGVDIQEFEDVGWTNLTVVQSLHLEEGSTYYATVRATDFVGLITEVVSEGITIDTTPPTKSDAHIDVGGSFLTSTSSLTARWTGVFEEMESGISYYEWCVGSEPGYGDVVQCTITMQDEIDNINDIELSDGHVYFVTVKAYNGAGLSSTASSWGIVVDSTPPEKGVVYDGSLPDFKDQDYQTHVSNISVRWKGFNDPHTAIVGYSLKIGRCPGCNDLLEEQFVGLVTDVEANYLRIEPGLKYYTTVTACNAAGLCTVVSSDGIIADNSPPVRGAVYDGVNDGDLAFQSSRTSLGAHWYNFHDTHSELSHYEWFAGTTPGDDDVVQSNRLHLTETAMTSQLKQLLPLHIPIYVTVRAFNKAELCTEASSNGVIVDDSAPVLVRRPSFDESLGSMTSHSQVFNSLLRVNWHFSDVDSPIQYHKLSVFTHHQSTMAISPIQVAGSTRKYTFTNLTLHDGDTYYVRVVACNLARLCAVSETEGILIDSSPPTVGTFAVATNHASNLTRHTKDGMTYLQSDGSDPAYVNLAWLGFADIHSGISHYFATVGTYFGSWDLTENKTVRVDYMDGVSHFDEGAVQSSLIRLTRDLIPWEHIYCTLWAINGAGLRSYEAHETFVVVPSNELTGILSLLRRCDSKSCQGDCTCAPQNQLCHDVTGECIDVTGDQSYQQVEVIDVVNYMELHDSIHYQNFNYTPSTCTIASKWREINGGFAIQRYEWTAGIKDGIPGAGLVNPATDRLWHEAGQTKYAVFTVEHGSLDPDADYVFYVKAWYDDKTFAIFHSNGIRPDFTPPQLSTSRKVKDIIDENQKIDMDFSKDANRLGVYWKNTFIASSEIDYFMVSLSTHPGGEDVVPFENAKVDATEYRLMLTGLKLQDGHKYYSNVMAVNHASLHTVASSDGILIDTNPPDEGVVHDGQGIHDTDFQNSSTIVSASWYGFSDLQSFIRQYRWCVGSQPGLDDILACRDIGLHLSASAMISKPVTTGMRYYSTVTAINAAGLESKPAFSDGITVDNTPPKSLLSLVTESNLITNPSFEVFDIDNTTHLCKPWSNGSMCPPKDWRVDGVAGVIVPSGSDAHSGNTYLIVHGSVSQTITTRYGETYKVSFFATHIPNTTVPLLSQEGYVQMPGIHRVFKLYQRTSTHGQEDTKWSEHIYYFTAVADTSMLVIGSIEERNGIALDNVKVQHMANDEERDAVMEAPNSCIQVNSRNDGKKHSLTVKWDVIDAESPIVEYHLAVGTMKGGTQVKSFTSVGRSSHTFIDDLSLVDGIPIHAIVVARNAAQLRSVFHSEPLIVDVTPPTICCVKDGSDIGRDVSHQTSSVIAVQWNITDKESGIDFCEWAVGPSPGSAKLSAFTKTNETNFTEKNLDGLLTDKQTVFSTVRCRNFAGLYSQRTSNGVTIVKTGPLVDEASLLTISSSPAAYEPRGNHQADANTINMVWSGFADVSGISHYECRLLGKGLEEEPAWKLIGLKGETSGKLKGIDMKSYGTYQVELRAVNYAGLKSAILSTNVTIETDPPILTGVSLESTWSSSDIVSVGWSHVFRSNSSLIYELTLSTVQAGSDIIKWYMTRQTSYEFFGAEKSQNYYVAITAVNEAGLYNTYNDVISYG
ncbi:uncharacterized protein [Ptychodera flava]|uniref:uncharacterized protein n=1 Tax=Ptychodera flava TaxID=63121 RepID=UPI00396A31B9